jgi:hypothetical protein
LKRGRLERKPKRKDRKESCDEKKGCSGVGGRNMWEAVCRKERQDGWMDERQEGRKCREKVKGEEGRED